MKNLLPLTILVTLLMTSDDLSAQEPASTIKESVYGEMPDGREVKLFTLTNEEGMVAQVTEYGAILVSLKAPDRDGKMADLTHGYDSLEGWLGNTSYFGSTVGRFGNRIADGKFSLGGEEYQLATNNDPGGMPCHLHGGIEGFDKKLWKGESFEVNGSRFVVFTYTSPDGEEGYPGELTVTVVYTLTDANQLVWEAKATTDKPTIVNIVHHSYWNLSGDPTTSINDHELTLFADEYLPTNIGLIPTGEIAPVAGTPMDFTKSTAIGARVDEEFEALEFGGGYDHAWVLDKTPADDLWQAARLHDPKTGRIMEVSTNQPAVQFYGGNFLDGTAKGKGGVPYEFRTALCLETENFPDAPNQPEFPSAMIKPGQTYYHKMVHTFSAE